MSEREPVNWTPSYGKALIKKVDESHLDNIYSKSRRSIYLSLANTWRLEMKSNYCEVYFGCRKASGFKAASLAALVVLAACGGGGDSSADRKQLDVAASAKSAAFAAYSRPDTYATAVQPDLLVPVRDGYQLTCDVSRPAMPDGTPAAGKFPSLLVSFTSYGRTDTNAGNDLRDFSKKGYAVVRCNTRGSQGIAGAFPSRPESVTPVNPFSPQEAQDNYDVIEWIAAQSWSTGKVGQVGTSYGGITSMQVAALAPPHLAAVIPIEATHDIYRDFARPGGTKLSPTAGDARGAWPPGCSLYSGEATCSDRIPALWDSHPTFDAFWEARVANLQAITVPVLFLSGVNDFWMESQDRRWPTLSGRDNVATVIGPWPHTFPEREGFSPETKNMYLAWFDHWVADLKTAPLPGKATVQGPQAFGTKTWEGFAAWPPLSSEVESLYLTASGLRAEQGAASPAQITTAADGSSQTLTLESLPFTAARTLAGPVEVQLPLSFSAPDANIVVNVMSRGADGTLIDLGHPIFKRASHFESDATPSARVAGRVYTQTLTVPSKYWTFQPGERLVLTVSGAHPFLLNDQPAGTITVSLGAQSLIRAPMISR